MITSLVLTPNSSSSKTSSAEMGNGEDEDADVEANEEDSETNRQTRSNNCSRPLSKPNLSNLPLVLLTSKILPSPLVLLKRSVYVR